MLRKVLPFAAGLLLVFQAHNTFAMDTMQCRPGFICKGASTAFTLATRTDWSEAHVDLNTACSNGFTHYPSGTFCADKKLYRHRYKVTFTVSGVVHQEFMDYVPPPTFAVGTKGAAVPAKSN